MPEEPIYPRIVTAQELADWLGLSVRMVSNHAAEGHLVKASRGYDLKASLQAFIAYQRELVTGRGNSEMMEARRRLDLARAKLAETKTARETGELVPAAEVEREWAEICKMIRSRLLAIPSRLRHLFGHLTQMEIGALDREIRDALTELGEGTN